MPQSSLTSWLNKSSTVHKSEQPASLPPLPPPSAMSTRPPPPPKFVSAPGRVPPSTTAAPTMDNWNDIPDDFLQPPSRPRSKKSPRTSRTNTPTSTPRVPSPAQPLPQQAAMSELFSLRPLPANVQLVPLTMELMPAFKRLNSLTLPIPYPESFYKETMTEPYQSITLVALWHTTAQTSSSEAQADAPLLVGAVRCRLLPSSQLYISTIGVLAPYRAHGIAMHLLQAVVTKAADLHGVRCITAHVWEANDEGLEWYKKRNFETIGKEEEYYRKLRPQSAFLVRKWIGVGDLLGSSSTRNTHLV